MRLGGPVWAGSSVAGVEGLASSRARRAIEAVITPLGRELLEQARHRMAVVLLDGLRAHAHDLEHTVAVAREAVCILLNVLVSEIC
jgi:hypothetical protein